MSVGEVFRQYGQKYRMRTSIPLQQLKVMSAIEKCRTMDMGGHILECQQCGKKLIQYNSCRNRHCPQCQGDTCEKWISKRKQEMLPVSYYHIIFTIPSEMNPVILQNQKRMYNMLFKASAQTLLELASDRKYLGAKIGFMSILHTWGQNLMDHPHIHCLVPGCGISERNDYWLDITPRKYFIPMHVIAQLFRGKFMSMFNQEYEKGELILVGGLEYLKDKNQYRKLKNILYDKGWVVNIRPPFSNGTVVLEYLSRYLNRVAI